MNPQMMEAAMKMMKQLSPEQMAQMMGSVGNMDPAMMQQQMRMMQNMSPADMERMQQQIGSMDATTLASQAEQAQKMMSAQQKYVLDGSNMLKADGNKLHAAGRYSEAAEKYARARDNLASMSSSEAVQLRRACVLNLSSCYLNLNKHKQCVEACQEVLTEDPQNLKALYRRGQAYAALHQYVEAESDLKAAAVLSKADKQQLQLIQDKLAAVQEKLTAGHGQQEQQEEKHTQLQQPTVKQPEPQEQPQPAQQRAKQAAQPSNDSQSQRGQSAQKVHNKAVVEEEDGLIEDEDSDEPPAASPSQQQAQVEMQMPSPPSSSAAAAASSRSRSAVPPTAAGFGGVPTQQMQEMAEMMRSNPGMMQQAAEMMRAMPPEQLAEMSKLAGVPGIDPDSLAQMQRSMASMSPEQMQLMMRMQANLPATPADALKDPAAMEKIAEMMQDPSMMKAATDMMKAMSPEQLKAAMAQAGSHLPPGMAEQFAQMSPEQLSTVAQQASSQAAAAPVGRTNAAAAAVSGSSLPSSSGRDVAGASLGAAGAAGMPDMSAMMSPEMLKAASEMMKNMKPEDMAAMSQMMGGGGPPAAGLSGLAGLNPRMMESMVTAMKNMDEGTLKQMLMSTGMVKSDEQAAMAAAQLKQMSPEMMQVMTRLMGVGHTVAQAAQKAREWLASRQLLALALIVLVVAILLRVFGIM